MNADFTDQRRYFLTIKKSATIRFIRVHPKSNFLVFKKRKGIPIVEIPLLFYELQNAFTASARMTLTAKIFR